MEDQQNQPPPPQQPTQHCQCCCYNLINLLGSVNGGRGFEGALTVAAPNLAEEVVIKSEMEEDGRNDELRSSGAGFGSGEVPNFTMDDGGMMSPMSGELGLFGMDNYIPCATPTNYVMSFGSTDTGLSLYDDGHGLVARGSAEPLFGSVWEPGPDGTVMGATSPAAATNLFSEGGFLSCVIKEEPIEASQWSTQNSDGSQPPTLHASNESSHSRTTLGRGTPSPSDTLSTSSLESFSVEQDAHFSLGGNDGNFAAEQAECSSLPKNGRNSSIRQAGSSQQSHRLLSDRIRYHCETCQKGFSNHTSLVTHRKEHALEEPLKPFFCTTCNRDYASLSSYRSHLKRHRNCTRCGKQLENAPRGSSEANEDELFCDECKPKGARVQGSKKLKRLNTQGGRPRASDRASCQMRMELNYPFKCEEPGCDAMFETNHGLQNHRVKHMASTSFPCDQCDRTFKMQHHLNHHRSTHFKSKEFACKTCGKEFGSEATLKTHQKKATVSCRASKRR